MAESNGCGADKRRSGQDSAGDIVLYSLGRYGKQPVSGGRRIGEQVELRASSAFTGMVGLSSDRGFTGGERRYRRVQQPDAPGRAYGGRASSVVHQPVYRFGGRYADVEQGFDTGGRTGVQS